MFSGKGTSYGGISDGDTDCSCSETSEDLLVERGCVKLILVAEEVADLVEESVSNGKEDLHSILEIEEVIIAPY